MQKSVYCVFHTFPKLPLPSTLWNTKLLMETRDVMVVLGGAGVENGEPFANIYKHKIYIYANGHTLINTRQGYNS